MCSVVVACVLSSCGGQIYSTHSIENTPGAFHTGHLSSASVGAARQPAPGRPIHPRRQQTRPGDPPVWRQPPEPSRRPGAGTGGGGLSPLLQHLLPHRAPGVRAGRGCSRSCPTAPEAAAGGRCGRAPGQRRGARPSRRQGGRPEGSREAAPGQGVPGRRGGVRCEAAPSGGGGAARGGGAAGSRLPAGRRRGSGRPVSHRSPRAAGTRRWGGRPSMSEKKQPVDLGLLEEDDEFEEFPAEGAG